jgi:DUF4097 and DUF4098 domain-containing protein YvlB
MLRALALIPALLLAGCIEVDLGPSDRYRASFEYNYDLKPGARVSVDNSNGAIDIYGWNQDKIEITGEKYASTQDRLDDMKIDIRNQPYLIEIRTSGNAHGALFSNTGANYTIRVPRSARLDRIVSTNGRIEVRDIDAGARLRTSNGRIEGERIRGGVEAETSNGRVELHEVEGAITAHSSNGPVMIAMLKPPTDNLRAETSNGSITLRLPPETGARLEATTSNSRITSDFDITGHVRSDKHQITGDIGKGGAAIELHTSNGQIRIQRY